MDQCNPTDSLEGSEFLAAESLFIKRALPEAAQLYTKLLNSPRYGDACLVRLVTIDFFGNDLKQSLNRIVDAINTRGILPDGSADLRFWSWIYLLLSLIEHDGDELAGDLAKQLGQKFSGVRGLELTFVQFVRGALQNPQYHMDQRMEFMAPLLESLTAQSNSPSKISGGPGDFSQLLFFTCELLCTSGRAGTAEVLRTAFQDFQYQARRFVVRTVTNDFAGDNSSVLLTMQHFGNDAAGWAIPLNILSEESIVYSVGIGNDVSFDLELARTIGCQLYCFDPTPVGEQFGRVLQRVIDRCHFSAEALWHCDGNVEFFSSTSNPDSKCFSINSGNKGRREMSAPAACLDSLMKRYGHQHIDLLKIDIEGAEYEVIDNIIDAGLDISIIAAEFHGRPDKQGSEFLQYRRMFEAGYQVINYNCGDVTFIHRRALARAQLPSNYS